MTGQGNGDQALECDAPELERLLSLSLTSGANCGLLTLLNLVSAIIESG